MHYCSVEKISKSYGIQPLFTDLSFHINEGDRIALIAKNGTGKSTLLKMLAGQEHPEEGKIWLHKEVDVVFFEQNPSLANDKTVAENIFFHNHPVMNVIRDYEFAVGWTNYRPGMQMRK
jgi:ATP-binding cassette subfamily F protein uup